MNYSSLKKVEILTMNGANFFVQSLKTALENNEYEVKLIKLSETNVSDVKTQRSIVFLIADEFNTINTHFISAAKGYIVNNDHKVILLGGSDELHFVKRFIPESKIAGEFSKPIDVNEVVDKTEKYINILLYESVKKTILVVDDSGAMLRTINSWFGERYNVVLANSAPRAREVIEKKLPDLVLLDYEMPDVSGADFLKELRNNDSTKNLPVIFLTSKGDGSVVKSVIALRPEGYLLKTLPKDDIIKKVDDFFKKQACK